MSWAGYWDEDEDTYELHDVERQGYCALGLDPNDGSPCIWGDHYFVDPATGKVWRACCHHRRQAPEAKEWVEISYDDFADATVIAEIHEA